MKRKERNSEEPLDREEKLLAEAEAENAVEAQREFMEAFSAKSQLRKNWNRFSSGFNLSIPMPRFSLMKIERRNRKNKP